MRSTMWILAAAFTLPLLGCSYNPALPKEPFWCGPGGACPDGYKCYGGVCREKAPACLDHSDPQFDGWPSDADIEPNNHPSLAYELPCLGDPVTDPTYSTRCPSRSNASNYFGNLLICPSSDRDIYALYLLSNEILAIEVLYQYSDTPPRNLDAKVWRYDYVTTQYVEVAVGQSTNDNESITLSTETSTGNPAGWYFLEVYGASDQDVNFYHLTWTLNPT
jgi:hypothetical protein